MPYRPEAYDNIRQQMDENEYNLTQQLQQSNQQQMLAIQAAQNWASQNAAQNMQAAQQTFHLGFNNMANDLGWLRSAVPPFGQGGFQSQQMPSSLMNMSLGQSVMGAVGGFGVPNNVRVNDWQRMSVHDLGNRAGNLAASAPISAVELGADLASFGFLFNRASAAATAAGITGWGATGVGMAAGAFGAGILAGPVYNATEYVREQVSTQARLENMLFSSSYGKMPQTQRAGLASGMRHAIRQDD
jgi:hypothetical protein